MAFLPIKKEELNGQPDFIIITGEAYVDHPSFGHAIVSRLIESLGFSVAIIPQPQNESDYREFGEPRHAFMVSSGVVDSMVNNYTVAKRKRNRDVYSENGVYGLRPDRATIVYTKNLKRYFPKSPVIIGGIEPSLRRFAHYDYWSDKVMPSILIDAPADLLIYGMGEKPITELLEFVKRGVPIENLKDIRGTSYVSRFDDLSNKLKEEFYKNAVCPSYEEVVSDKLKYIESFNIQYKNNDYIRGKTVFQKHGDLYVVQNPPQMPLTTSEMDRVYALPYERTYHPIYKKGVPAIEEVEFSITANRGCFGNCNYCAITYHTGRVVQKRSKKSIVQEAKSFVHDPNFKGYIHDVGGPTANFRDPACENQLRHGVCNNKNCIGFKPCKNLKVDHSEYLDILRELRQIEGIKKVFIRSGIRYDYLMMDKNPEFFRELVKYHISGQLKIAPEHTESNVLKLMNKPPFSLYEKFYDKFYQINKEEGMNQFLVPYFISSHPGCTLNDAIELSRYLKSINYMPKQVQDFYPTPSTKSTCMYYTGINPDTMEKVYVPKSREEKRMQRALLQYRKPNNYNLIKQALIKAGRTELIGFTKDCLIKPTKEDIINKRFKNNKEYNGKNRSKFSKNRKRK